MTENNERKGVIIKGVGGLYTVRLDPTDSGEESVAVLCRARGIFRHEGITPLPGDRVTVSPTDSAEAENAVADEADFVIESIGERKNSLIRPALANLTHLFTVIPTARPKPDLYSADKLISAAENKGIEPVIIITKADEDRNGAESISNIYKTGGFSVFISDADGSGDGEILDYIEKSAKNGNFCAAFAGVSGAGKSTLMGRMFPFLSLKTGEVSRKIQRGRHTTRHAELYPFAAGESVGFVADTPGFSMIDFTRFNFVELEELPYSFREFSPLIGQCRYTKCTHTKEEGCAVLEAMSNGKIAKERHDSYVMMLEEIKKNPPWKRKKLQSE